MLASVIHEMVRMSEGKAIVKVTCKIFDADKVAAVYRSPYLIRGARPFQIEECQSSKVPWQSFRALVLHLKKSTAVGQDFKSKLQVDSDRRISLQITHL